MKVRWNLVLNFLFFIAVLFVVSGFQTTFWFQLFEDIPSPLLWLNLIVYVILYRRPTPAILTVYTMGFILLAFTGMPLKMMWITLLILFAMIYGIKSRVFWTGSGYYLIMCTFATAAYHIVYFFTSMILEKNPASPELLDRMIQIVLTPLFSIPMYWALSKIDRMTRDDLVHEPGRLDL